MPTNCTGPYEKDPVELLISRILRRVSAGSLVGGALGMAAGCGEAEPGSSHRERNDAPAVATDAASEAAKDPATPTPADGGGLTNAPPGAKDSGALDAPPKPAAEDAGRAPPNTMPTEPPGSCASGTTVMNAAELKLAQRFDYVSIRRTPGFRRVGEDAGSSESWTGTNFTTLSESGVACAGASNAECREKVVKHPGEFIASHCVQACSELSIVTTLGEQVERWATDAELRTVMGEVDSPSEALFLSTRAGYWDGCAKALADGYEVAATNYKETCPVTYQRVTLHVGANGMVTPGASVEIRDGGLSGACIGRIPAALTSESRAHHESALGDYLAHCAHLEDASVHAFERLAAELAAHGAPDALVLDALSAAADEVRHARIISELARARAGDPRQAEVAPLALRSLEEIARENAVEGCVRETYGALVGGYQALTASDAELRDAMRGVAEDEARHAALSQRVHLWAMAKLDARARSRVRAAQRNAIAELTRECETEALDELREPLGLPPRDVARALLGELSLALWSEALADRSSRSRAVS